jgi:hypothetical protein
MRPRLFAVAATLLLICLDSGTREQLSRERIEGGGIFAGNDELRRGKAVLQ